MVFSSVLFMFIYLPIVLAVYYICPLKWRNTWLFLVNFIFYGWGEPVYIVLMLLSTLLNYINGLMIEKYRVFYKKKAKIVLVFNIIINITLLVFFKYSDLLINTLNQTAGVVLIQPLYLTLPIGISFYTFQAMSYPIDLYRGDTRVEKNFLNFGTYVALFPQLIAGPIVRFKDVAEQIKFRAHSPYKFAGGVIKFTVGLAKKVLIANNIGILWDTYSAMPAPELTVVGSWLGIIAFTFQIYFDFSGYSDMAIGLGRMIGFEFFENFNYPYISKTVTEFWRRWHISLGTWFRDYVYIPLGGNRKGKKRQILNILIVWALTGLWHGSNWTFLIWGMYYAAFLIIEKLWMLKILDRAPSFIGHIYTIVVAICGWVIFELESLSKVREYYSAMFGLGNDLITSTDIYYLGKYIIVLVIAIMASTPLFRNLFNKMPEKVQTIAVPILTITILTICTAYLVDSTYNPFLYFRF